MNHMNRILCTVATLLLIMYASQWASAAGNPFIGEWKLNPSMSRMPDEMKVESKGGSTYASDFGGGVGETIVADGSDQPGYGGTTLSVKADAPDTWIVERKKSGQLLLRGTWKLSQDGSTLTDLYREFEPDGSTLSMDYVYQRSGGGLGFAADWQSIKETTWLWAARAMSSASWHLERWISPHSRDRPRSGSRRRCARRQKRSWESSVHPSASIRPISICWVTRRSIRTGSCSSKER